MEDASPTEGVFTDVFTANMDPPKWVINDLLPPGLCILGGPPKAARKSTLTMAMAAIVNGYPCQVLPPALSVSQEQGCAMVFSAEASAGELRHMLERGMGVKGQADKGILVCDDPFSFRLDEQSDLYEWLDERKPKLVVIDPLRDFHSLDEKDSAGIINIIRPLRQWAIEQGSAVVVVHHTRKMAEGQLEYTNEDLRGTGALLGKADAVLMVTPLNDTGRLKVRATFKRATGWDRTMQLAAYGHGGTTGSEPLTDLDLQVQGLLLHNPRIPVADIARQVQKGPSTVMASVAKLRRTKGVPNEV